MAVLAGDLPVAAVLQYAGVGFFPYKKTLVYYKLSIDP